MMTGWFWAWATDAIRTAQDARLRNFIDMILNLWICAEKRTAERPKRVDLSTGRLPCGYGNGA